VRFQDGGKDQTGLFSYSLPRVLCGWLDALSKNY
jgi:hypothetical protein